MPHASCLTSFPSVCIYRCVVTRVFPILFCLFSCLAVAAALCVHTFLFCCVHTRASSVLFDVVVAEGLPVFLYACLLHVVFLVCYMENGRGVIFFGVFSESCGLYVK